MELKHVFSELRICPQILLIVPYGIETWSFSESLIFF